MKTLSVSLVALFILLCLAQINSTRLGLPLPLAPCTGADDCLWDLVKTNSDLIQAVVMVDLNIGAGSTVNQVLLDAVVNAQLAGVRVFAQVKTGYGKRSLPDVKAEVDLYVNLYKVNGIFFEEIPTECTCKKYYTDLYTHVKLNIAGLVVLNVGVNVPECFGLFADILVVFDSSYAEYVKFVPLPWYKKYPPSTFWHSVHECSREEQRSALWLATRLGVGLFHVTEGPKGSEEIQLLDVLLLVRLLDLLTLSVTL